MSIKTGWYNWSQMTRGLRWQSKEIKVHSLDKRKAFEGLRVGTVEGSGINKQEKGEADFRQLEDMSEKQGQATGGPGAGNWCLLAVRITPKFLSILVFPHSPCQI